MLGNLSVLITGLPWASCCVPLTPLSADKAEGMEEESRRVGEHRAVVPVSACVVCLLNRQTLCRRVGTCIGHVGGKGTQRATHATHTTIIRL